MAAAAAARRLDRRPGSSYPPEELIYTPGTADLGPERRAERIRAYLADLRGLSGEGRASCGWALEAIAGLMGDLGRARGALETLSQRVPPSGEVPLSRLSILPPSPGRGHRSPRNPKLSHIILKDAPFAPDYAGDAPDTAEKAPKSAAR